MTRSPAHTPIKEMIKVTSPIIIMGFTTVTSRRAKLMPAAKASMLVAMESEKSTATSIGSVFFWAAPVLNASYIILPPIIKSRENTIQ